MEHNKTERVTMTVVECAKLCGISRALAYSLVQQNRIPSIRISDRRIVIPVAALEKFLSEASNKTTG